MFIHNYPFFGNTTEIKTETEFIYFVSKIKVAKLSYNLNILYNFQVQQEINKLSKPKNEIEFTEENIINNLDEVIEKCQTHINRLDKYNSSINKIKEDVRKAFQESLSEFELLAFNSFNSDTEYWKNKSYSEIYETIPYIEKE